MVEKCDERDVITLRRAEQGDARNLFEWRNADETRRFARDPQPIPWEDHVRWFNETLTRSDRFLLIGEISGRPIGVLRFDVVAADVVEVSIYLVPGLAGRGLGTVLLRAGGTWLAEETPIIKRIRAVVLQGNAASQNAFVKAGYLVVAGIYEKCI